MTTPLLAEPFNPVFQLDPYPSLAKLRLAGSLHRVPHPFLGEIWLTTHHRLVREVHSDPRWVKPIDDDDDGVASFDSPPPEHTRLRGLVQKAFTVRRIEQLRAWATEMTDGLLDRLAARGTVDLVTEYADAMPIEVIRKMAGLPPEYAAELVELMQGFLGEADLERQRLIFERAEQYVAGVIESKRAAPGGDDLASDLIAVRDGSDRLTEPELVKVLMTLLVNGAATTTNVIGTGALALLENPDQYALLAARPELTSSAVEEMLRYECPVGGIAWAAAADQEFEGVRFGKGEILGTSLQAANRDPAVFPDPDRFDITRAPNPHLTFSHGIHRCLGAELARMELQVAIGALVRRFTRIGLAGRPRWRGGPAVRGLLELPVTLA
ncbi:cytochrome P450 [Amycolatopsis minnesotensis]|uniref:Cytochrome P450 n=1 Tax=Amycolatopsis minnesotensis TaxID=337894 RepID=A0ABN2QMU2_9PSEU